MLSSRLLWVKGPPCEARSRPRSLARFAEVVRVRALDVCPFVLTAKDQA